jgi:hypothetical protein
MTNKPGCTPARHVRARKQFSRTLLGANLPFDDLPGHSTGTRVIRSTMTKPAAAKTNKPKDRKTQRATSAGLTRAQAAAQVVGAARLEPVEDVSDKPAAVKINKRKRLVGSGNSPGLTRAQAAAEVVAAFRLDPIEDNRPVKRKVNVSNKDDTKLAVAKTDKPKDRKLNGQCSESEGW